MDAAGRAAIVNELAVSFGSARDVTPGSDQPLHVLLDRVNLAGTWTPNPVRCLTVFRNWPAQRPEFYVDSSVKNQSGEPPRSHSRPFVLGEGWLAFSWQFPWTALMSATKAVEKWLARFAKPE